MMCNICACRCTDLHGRRQYFANQVRESVKQQERRQEKHRRERLRSGDQVERLRQQHLRRCSTGNAKPPSLT